MVSGAGIIQDKLSAIGGQIANSLYGLVSGTGIDIPILGNITLASLLPDSGEDIGSTLGSQIGETIESIIGSIPLTLIGSWLSGLPGNQPERKVCAINFVGWRFCINCFAEVKALKAASEALR